jgi:CRP/FNR family transcriptional regulator
LISGSIRLFRSTPDGREVTIHLVEPGDLFAEIVLFERDTYPASAVAVGDSLVNVIDRAQIHHLLDDTLFRDDFLKNLVGKMRFLSQQLYVLTTMEVEERLARFLEIRLGRFTSTRFTLSKKDTAAAISVRPETLSRALTRLDEAGLLRWKRGTIEATPEFWTRGD